MILIYLTLRSIHLMSWVLSGLLLLASPVGYFNRTVSKWRQDWLWILLLIDWLALGRWSSAVVIVGWSTSILNRWQRITISNDHTIIVWKHLLMRLTSVLFRQAHLRGRMRLWDSNSSLILSALNFWRVLTIFSVACWAHWLTMMVSGGWNTVTWNIAMIVSAASRSHWWIDSMPVTRHLFWSRSWSSWWRHLVEITRWGGLFFGATVLVSMLGSWRLVWGAAYITRLTLTHRCWALGLWARSRFCLGTTCRGCRLILIIHVRRGLSSIWWSALPNMTVAGALSSWCSPLRSILSVFH